LAALDPLTPAINAKSMLVAAEALIRQILG